MSLDGWEVALLYRVDGVEYYSNETQLVGQHHVLCGLDRRHADRRRPLHRRGGASQGRRHQPRRQQPARLLVQRTNTLGVTQIFFTAFDGVYRDVWRSDGTDAGTEPLTAFIGATQLAGFTPSPADATGDNPVFFAVVGGWALFSAVDAASGAQVWAYDTVADTGAVYQVPGALPAGMALTFFTATDFHAYFTATSPSHHPCAVARQQQRSGAGRRPARRRLRRLAVLQPHAIRSGRVAAGVSAVAGGRGRPQRHAPGGGRRRGGESAVGVPRRGLLLRLRRLHRHRRHRRRPDEPRRPPIPLRHQPADRRRLPLPRRAVPPRPHRRVGDGRHGGGHAAAGGATLPLRRRLLLCPRRHRRLRRRQRDGLRRPRHSRQPAGRGGRPRHRPWRASPAVVGRQRPRVLRRRRPGLPGRAGPHQRP